MKNSIILELVNGGTCYTDKAELFNNEEYRKSSEDFYNIIDELCKNLSEDEKREALDKIFNALGDMESVSADEYFKKGFRLGLTLSVQNFLD